MKEETKNLLVCISKTTFGYWKNLFIISAIIGGLYLVVSAANTMVELFSKPCYDAIKSFPPLAYAISALIVLPVVLATIVCYYNRDKKKIEKEDEIFTCPE